MKKFMFAAIAALVMVSVSNVFASSRMFSNAQVAPVDTVAPNAPSDSLAVDAPVQPQAAAEDSTQQETTEQKETTEQQTADQTATEQLQSSRRLLNNKIGKDSSFCRRYTRKNRLG